MANGFPGESLSSSEPALSAERRPMASAAQPVGGGVLAGDPQVPPPPSPLSAGEFLLNLLQKRPQPQADSPPPPPPALPGGAILEAPGNPFGHGISFLPPGFLDFSASPANPLPPWPDHQVFPPGNWTSLESRPPPPPGFHRHEQISQIHHSPPQRSPPGFPPQLGFLGGHFDPRNQQHQNLHHLQHHHHHQQQQSSQLIFGSFATPLIAESHRPDREQANLPDQRNSISGISPRSGPIHPPKSHHLQGSQAFRHMNSDNLHRRPQSYHQNEISDGRIRSPRTNGKNLNLIFEEKLKIEDANQNSISTVNTIEDHKGISNDSTEEREVISEELVESSMVKSSDGSRIKDYRSDFSRGHHVSSQRMRYRRRELRCRRDISIFTPQFMAIYEFLTPPEEEKVKQIQLLQYLEKLVIQEWPDAQLHLYGSCANSFGASNSDIDVCLQIHDLEIEKSEILLRLAEILEANDLQDVQALTRARVPIVKLKHPATNISCDICINNILAVVNTKLLRDYSQIDHRLRQLVFIVKHWAKARGVNDTYQGTLSSYAYVLMCIHFLQTRRPAVLPCLQKIQSTYEVKVDGVECAFFDRVEKLQNFGSKNRESIAELLWAFFNYWAYHHDYTNDVISVRTGGIISKQSKDWTRRIGNDRHLVCIEDPFELSHDLGRVVDKFTIKILREEFERAADIVQFDPNPAVRLFEPYVRPPPDHT